MALEVRVSGAANLHKVAAQIRAEGRKDLAREMSAALTKATEPVQRAIRASAGQTMPRSGGYNAAFDKSLRFRNSRRTGGSQASVNLATYADGASERRDIKALEGGNLRHPVFGRSRPGARKGERTANPWTVTSIRAGFWKRGTDGAMDEAQKQLETVIEGLASRLAGK
jgi:hypothetical protein